jgi:hypothetical protein
MRTVIDGVMLASRTKPNLTVCPAGQLPRKPSTMFMVAPDKKTEELLANACESLASASVMLSDFAGLLGTPYRPLLGIQQVVMLGKLTVRFKTVSTVSASDHDSLATCNPL